MIHPQSSKQDPSSKQFITEQQMISLSSQCYILLEKYKLKTNLVSVNTPKDLIDYNYNYLEQRMIDRYDRIYDKLQQGLEKLKNNFVIAQANTLRTLNNIFRNYRRRVGTLSNEPLSNFKYSRYDKQEKLLLQSIIYNDKQNYHQIKSFKNQLQRNIQLGSKEIEEKYKPNQKIKQNYQLIFDVIDKTECHTFKYYDNFQRSMLTTVQNLQAHFDKLNTYLSVWENVGSTKAYEVKSAKQIQYEQKAYENDRNRRYFDDQTEEQLEQLMKNSPPHSPQREEYRKRLAEVRRYNSEKQKKLDNVGKMYSKRRNRAGILVNKNKDINILQLVINLENTKVPYNYHDQFKNYRADNEQTDYRLTLYEIQKPMKTIEEIKTHLQKYRQGRSLNFEWWYDRFGKNGYFDLIVSQSQQVQKRIEFQFVRQTQLQNTDDRRKRELLQKQNYQMREAERKEYLHIGYLHVHDKTELQWLMQRTYNTQYIPGMMGQPSQDISFSDQQISHKDQLELQQPKNLVVIVKESQVKNIQVPFVEKQKTIQQKQHQIQQPIQQKQQNGQNIYQNLGDMSLQEQLIKIYFKEYSKKIVRKQSEPQYRKTQFLYYKSLNEVNWPILQKYLNYQNIFIFTLKSIVFFKKIFSASKQKIKCNIYTVQQDQEDEQKWQEGIKHNIQTSIKDCSLITVIFHPIYVQNQSLSTFMIGLLITLMRQGKMPQDYELKDYVNQGREIIEDFNQYFFPRDNISPKNLIRRHRNNNQQQKAKKEVVSQTLSVGSTINTSSLVKKPIVQEQKIQTKVEDTKYIQIQPKLEQKVAEYDTYLGQAIAYEQKQLKRSDSRQFLNKYGQQIELANYELGEKEEVQDSGDQQFF